MAFLTGDDLDKAVRQITKGAEVRCAVAFWGRDAAHLFGPRTRREIRIVCNLRSGGTNPDVIKKLSGKGARIRQHDDPHAKVYIGEGRAVVTSANASANGLGLEGVEQARRLEAGVSLSEVGPMVAWFEGLWSMSREITDADLNAAKAAWEKLRRNRSTIAFRDFDVEAEPVSLIFWWTNSKEWTICRNNVKDQLGFYNEEIAKRIDNSIEIQGPEDEVLLRPGTWILFWHHTDKGLPNRRSGLGWFCAGPIVRKAYRYEGAQETYDALLPAEDPPPEPFDASDRLLLPAFRDVLERDASYMDLRVWDYEGAWFALRQKLIRQLWRDLKQRYLELEDKQRGSGIEGNPRIGRRKP